MYLYEDQFAEEHDFPRVEGASRTLIIASTGRCGSHMLGHVLHRTGSFGFPLEYANPANLAEWRRRLCRQEIAAVMTELQHRRTSPSGVFGIKLHYGHIQAFGGFSQVLATFPDPYFVLLSRKDVLRQAISLSIATQTGVWIAGQQPTNDRPPQYHFEHIRECLRKTIQDNASWRYRLASNGCNYIEMEFGAVKQDAGAAVQRIAEFMDVDVDVNRIPDEPVTTRQSKGLNAEWERRFLADSDGSDELFASGRPDLIDRIKGRVKRLFTA